MGHGHFRVGRGTVHQAHRVTWEWVHGPVPRGLCVLHKCDTPPCVRPAHLFLGTRGDNNADMAAKGRARSTMVRAKLSDDAIALVLRLRAEGQSQQKIGEQVGVTQVTISRLLLGKSYRSRPFID